MASALGVKIEAQYSVGEYDIVVLGAKDSSGLIRWLVQNGYKLPKNAEKAVEPYIKQDLKFFVAKVNLKEQQKTGFTYLRPIQFAYESSKFMLPLRLGMLNANGPQDMLVYAITRRGRVETTNYRTVKLPSGMDIPLFVKDKFADFYQTMFQKAYEKEDKRVVFQEYAWNMGSCDPCSADPLRPDELRKLGVFWISDAPVGGSPVRRGLLIRPGGRPNIEAFLTRLHVRYDAEHFPEDLNFQETSDVQPFQGRYVLRHPWEGSSECSQADEYRKGLSKRHNDEAEMLASLTGREMKDILKRTQEIPGPSKPQPDKKWYEGIFK